MFKPYFFALAALLVSSRALAGLPRVDLPADLSAAYRFELLTPTGEKVFRNSVLWYSGQIDHPEYPQPAKCAANVSKVYRMSGLNAYSAQSVAMLLKKIVDGGGPYVKLPKDKAGMIERLNAVYGGRLPAGAAVGGCLHSDCFRGETGQRHSAIVADTGPDGTVYLYHNNWYRPENEGGVWKEHMVSRYYLDRGFRRQWMKTPWIRIVRGPDGRVSDVKPLLPAIDDLDPTQYFVSIAIPAEIAAEAVSAAALPKAYLRGFPRAPLGDLFDVELDDDGSRLER
ncbi:MAG TPA: hypothetical protein DDW67_04935 [Elusimicrobia bacterium]|nr:hypothetical protein [Elusimicrobiota bacterium]